MAIDFSYGYPGTIEPGAVWAQMQWGLGNRYWVYSQSHLRVTPVSNGTRQVSVASGFFGGCGILDHNDASVTVSLPTVSSGTKWFLIVARRTWQTTNATSFTYIDCGTSPTYPAERNQEPGVIDDQPLAFVPLTAGSTVPGTPRDVRVIGTSPDNQIIMDELALGYMTFTGVRLRLGTTDYVRGLNASGSPVWQIDRGPFGRNAISVGASGWGTSYTGWTTANLNSRMIRDGNLVQLDLRIRRTLSSLPVDQYGHIGDTPIMNLNSEWRPSHTTYGACSYIAPDGRNYQGLLNVGTDGDVSIIAGTGNKAFAQRTDPSSWTVSTSMFWIQTGAS